MRTDVKLGVAVSMIVVLITGGYFMYRGESEAPIPLAQGSDTLKNVKAQPEAGKDVAPADGQRRVADGSDNAPRRTPRVRPAQRRNPRVAGGSSANRPGRPQRTGQRSGSTPTPTPNTQAVARRNVPREAVKQPAASPTAPTGDALAAARTGSKTPGSESPITAARGGEGVSGSPSRLTTGPHTQGRPIPLSATPNRPAPTSTAPATAGGLSTRSGSVDAAGKSAPRTSPGTTPREAGNRAAVDTHRVQPGDSFASLSKAYYGTEKYARFLMSANPQVTEPTRLQIGAALKIPPPPADADSRPSAGQSRGSRATESRQSERNTSNRRAGQRTYRVLPGDSFYRIARDKLGDASRWRELLTLNEALVKGDPKKLKPGQMILLPD